MNMKAHLLLFLTNLRYSVMLKISFSGPKPQNSSSELNFLFLNLFTSIF